jgi:plasmid replication initiation protein
MSKPVEQHIVAKSNLLIRASYKLTLNEQRLILFVIAGINSKRVAIRPGFNQVDAIRITAAEFAEAWNLPPKEAYFALKEATVEMYERSITEIVGKRVEKMRWINRIVYHDGEGWAELSLSPHVVPYLTDLGNKFTEYRLGQVANLRSTHAIRLFEWCVQFADTGWMQLTIEEITQRLDVAYTRYADVRRYIVEPAVRELQSKSNIDISWKPIKTGRQVTAVKFTFSERSAKPEKAARKRKIKADA